MEVREESNWQTDAESSSNGSATCRETIADAHEGRFPERCQLMEMEMPYFDEVLPQIAGAPSTTKD